MQLYLYEGIPLSSKKKKILKGYMLVESKEDLKNILKKKKNISATKIKEIPNYRIKLTSVNAKEIALFFDGFAKMIEVGISIPQALDNLISEQYNIKLTYFLYQLKNNVEEGMSLPNAIKMTGFFPSDIEEMIRVGDESGKIIQVLRNLKSFYEQKAVIRKAIIGALTYPIVVFLVSLGVLIFLAPKMIKPMIEIFKDMKSDSFPVLTIYVMDTVNWISAWSPVIISVIIGTVWFIRHKYKNSIGFKKQADALLLSFPLTGIFITKLAIYKFLMSLEILYNAGISINKALKMIEQSEANYHIREDFAEMSHEIEKGQNLASVIKNSEYMPDIYKSLISIGQDAGNVGDTLQELTSMASDSFNAYAEVLKKIMTPISTAIVGGIVGVIIMAVYLPIISMIDLAK